jgi:hypothetical protein
MTAQAVLDLPGLSPTGPTVLHEVRDLPGWLRAANDAITGVRACLDDQGVAVSIRDVQAIERLARRLDAAKLAALGRLDAARRAGDHREDDGGAASTSAHYARATRTDGAAAARDTDLARRLVDGDQLASTRAAMDDGTLSAEHAKVIARAMAGLPDGLTVAEREQVERRLVEQARILDPAKLRRAARRALAALARPEEEVDAHHDRQLRDEEQRARAKARFTMHDNGDGTCTGHFTLPTAAAAILRKILQSMTAPRRQPSRTPDDADTTSGRANTARGDAFRRTPTWAADTHEAPTCRPATEYTDRDGFVDSRAMATDWAYAQGLAFASLIEHLPTGHLHSKIAATVIVTVGLDQLRAGIGAATTDTGIELSAAETRRTACQAGILPAVLGGNSLPLDLGRDRRLFTNAQRLAFATIYDTCAVDGCDRPFAWTEIHHLDPWADGGGTDLSNGVPACASHHHRLDDPDYEHRIVTDQRGKHTVYLRRRT